MISKKALIDFAKTHADALEALMHWYAVAETAEWNTLPEIRKDFRHADNVGKFTVFNIGGNKYRLITVIKPKWHMVYIRHVLTHKEYDSGKWKE